MLTKKELLEAIKDMPMNSKIKIGTEKDGISDAVFIILGKTKKCNQITILDFKC
jgi:hypothetical protein